MKIARHLLLLTLITLTCACGQKNTSSKPRTDPPADFKKLLDAYGNWEKWTEAKALSFAMIHETTLAMENHYVSLGDRKIRIDGGDWQMGNDGEKLWISPTREAFKGTSVRFYHNLYFYFFSIPYIFTDPGVVVEKTENKLVNGQSYETFQVSFEANVGDSPDDNYFMLIDPVTGRVAWLLYRVTFFDKTNTKMSALKYDGYQDVEGLAFPKIMTGYQFANDSTQSLTYQVSFSDIFLVDEPLDEALFAMPETNAVVAN